MDHGLLGHYFSLGLLDRLGDFVLKLIAGFLEFAHGFAKAPS